MTTEPALPALSVLDASAQIRAGRLMSRALVLQSGGNRPRASIQFSVGDLVSIEFSVY